MATAPADHTGDVRAGFSSKQSNALSEHEIAERWRAAGGRITCPPPADLSASTGGKPMSKLASRLPEKPTLTDLESRVCNLACLASVVSDYFETSLENNAVYGQAYTYQFTAESINVLTYSIYEMERQVEAFRADYYTVWHAEIDARNKARSGEPKQREQPHAAADREKIRDNNNEKPDAELINLCSQCLEALGHFEAVFAKYSTNGIADRNKVWKIEKRCGKEASAVYDKEVAPLLDRIAEMEPVTIDGFAAKAYVLVKDGVADWIGDSSHGNNATSGLLRELANRATAFNGGNTPSTAEAA